jgi:plasmid stabilization system protein ParE
MGYDIYITPSALADMRIAVDFYNSRTEDLGRKMSYEVDDALHRIAAAPKSYSIRHKNKRAAKVRSFPFLIFYKILEKDKIVQVLRIFHTSQKPFWTI